ncbi:hypothetical protein QS257_09015 [Terrilactibacillus sp. S3-3]|nr:hypothetical protein QS257_09015 [Terrilactibacillus sp. S3-3]
MKKKKTFFFILVLACLLAFFLFYFEKNQRLQESMTNYPDDSKLHYQSAETRLSMLPRPARFNWQVESAVNKKVYLRQDLSLLYRNNRLYAIMNHWQTQSRLLGKKKKNFYRPPVYMKRCPFIMRRVAAAVRFWGKINYRAMPSPLKI